MQKQLVSHIEEVQPDAMKSAVNDQFVPILGIDNAAKSVTAITDAMIFSKRISMEVSDAV